MVISADEFRDDRLDLEISKRFSDTAMAALNEIKIQLQKARNGYELISAQYLRH